MPDSSPSSPARTSHPLAIKPLMEYWAAGWRGRDWARQLGILALVAGLLVILQPFGSFEDPVGWRFVYWLAMLCVMVWIILPALAVALLKHDRISSMAAVPGALGLYLIASLPMTLIVATVDLAFAVIKASVADGLTLETVSARLAFFFPPPEGLGVYLSAQFTKVAAISLLSLGLITLVSAGRWAKVVPQSATAPKLRPGLAFFSRLPPAIGTSLILLRMEDHYVRAVTRDGQALILMRLSDAIAELGDFPGLQVHRSWWVAVGEIQSVSRRGKALVLIMADGSRVPVSSSFRSSVDGILGAAIQRPASGD